MMLEAEKVVEACDLLLVIGTSLNVYPAANLLYHVQKNTPIWVIDPNTMDLKSFPNSRHIQKKAEEGMQEVLAKLMQS
jgi:NAD-dependent deacetylase